MKPIDIAYQESVDREANKVLKLTVDEFLKIADYGIIETTINGRPNTVDFWHYKLSDKLHHIVFQKDRRCYLILYKKYLSGVKLENGKLLKLTDKEIGDYD